MIQTEKEYNAIVERIVILLQNSDNIENQDNSKKIDYNLKK